MKENTVFLFALSYSFMQTLASYFLLKIVLSRRQNSKPVTEQGSRFNGTQKKYRVLRLPLFCVLVWVEITIENVTGGKNGLL